jgi:hypothetical protein
MLFTGESGVAHGYDDGWGPEGVFYYWGEGQEGDMQFVRGNKAIRDHVANGKDLHLFQSVDAGFVQYLGCLACASCEYQDTPDGSGKPRRGIRFHLAPVESAASTAREAATAAAEDPAELRRRAYEAVEDSGPAAPDLRRPPRWHGRVGGCYQIEITVPVHVSERYTKYPSRTCRDHAPLLHASTRYVPSPAARPQPTRREGLLA